MCDRRLASVLIGLLLFTGSLLAADEEKKKWDVANPDDETFTIDIETDEGTWMSLDVSPDGKSIVFDMLGDIFTLPIGGGDATPIASGLPWEMQPRFSPDGKRIMFTSDRGGGDNIWVMDLDGSNVEQVTKESFRLLNNAVWSPDGQYVAARKHYTASRSLGAGEIWLYHRSGGAGIQLTKKPNDQKDLGEPAFSPDGKYIYFSQDVTPGPTFQYSKDPAPGIYAIKRYDRETGEIDTYISGAGGAVRPTPSPDGKYLAFVRRKNYDTALWLYEIATGKSWPIYDKLDRDLQETWAIHGVYANFAWTPDSKQIVFWANGKIHNLDLASGNTTNIPFKVKTKHTMVQTLRFALDVAPPEVELNMLRWVNVSPDGKRVLYQTLGHIYVKDLPNGKPKRLTSQEDHFEFYPSFSRDGKSVVYVSWHDEKLGAVMVADASGGESRAITNQPGHYIEPTFSPDGKQVAFNKVQGGYIRSGLYGHEPGLYIAPVAGGEAKHLTKGGSQPHFADRNDTLYFVAGGAKRTLRSVDVNTKETRDLMENEMGGEYRVSPDGKWLALTNPYSAYVAAFPKTGKKISLGPGTKSIPMKKLSVEAGNYLHWNADSSRLYWSLGNQLFHRDLKDAFSFLEGAPEDMPEPVSEGTYIGMKIQHDQPMGLIALQGARIISMDDEYGVIEDGVVVIEGNRIMSIGKSGDIVVPEEAEVIDVAGHTIIPGLIDVHAHGPYGSQEIIPQQNWSHYGGLAFGVTTVHDPSSDTSTIFAAAEMAKAGKILAPRIFSTGTILYGAKIPQFTSKIESLEDARFHVRRTKAAGAITVKSYNQPRRDQRQQVIKAGREEGIMVVPEGGSLFMHNMTMIADGHTGVEHAIPVADAYSDVVQFWSGSKTFYTPTTGVGYGGIWGENYWYDKTDVWKHPRLTKYVPNWVLEPRSRRRTKAPDEEYNHFRITELCKKFTDAGVRVTVGAHGQREGLAAHWEMWMFAQGGMTPMEVLQTGTINGAQYLGLDRDLGSLTRGKLADLVVLKDNPLDNIRNTENIAFVMLNGRLYNDNMDEVAPGNRKRQPFFWERDAQGGINTATSVDASTIGKCHH